MVDRRLSTMSAIDHSRAPMEGSSALAERKQMLARVDDLAGQSALVLSRLSRRMLALEEDVAPVHEQTRNMYLQHKNLGLGIAALGDFCEQLQCVIRLKQQLDLESRDWEKLTSALQDVTDCVSFLRGHRTFSHNRQIIATVEDVRTAAVDTLQEDYCRIVEGFPSAEHGGKMDDFHKECAAELVRLREAMSVGESDHASELLMQLRTEASVGAVRKMQRFFLPQQHDMSSNAVVSVPYQRGKHALVRAGPMLVEMLSFEQELAKRALTNTAIEWESAYNGVIATVVPLFVDAVAQAVQVHAKGCKRDDLHPAMLTRTVLVLLETHSTLRLAVPRMSDVLRGLEGGSTLARKVEGLVQIAGEGAAACLTALAPCVAGYGAVKARGKEASMALGVDETARVVATFALQLMDERDSAERVLSRGGAGGEEGMATGGGTGEVGEVLRGIWDAVETNLQAKARMVREGKAGGKGALVLLLNNHFMLQERLQANEQLARFMGRSGERTGRMVEEDARQLVQRTWLTPLQVLSGVHVPSRKLQSDGLYSRSSRHAIKQALSAFNSEVDAILNNKDLRIEEEVLRMHLVQSSCDFVLPVYAEFLDKFASTRSFSKHPDKYLLYPLERLRPLLHSSLFAGHLSK